MSTIQNSFVGIWTWRRMVLKYVYVTSDRNHIEMNQFGNVCVCVFQLVCLLFIFREDMEKVNIKFHDNYTVTYQHKKILQFVPELSIDRNVRVMTPNIPLLVCIKQCLPNSISNLQSLLNFITNWINIWINTKYNFSNAHFHHNRRCHRKRIKLVQYLGRAYRLRWQWRGYCMGRSFSRLYRCR